MRKKVQNIGIGFITGRKSFRNVLTTYMNSWAGKMTAVKEPVKLSLFVAYDLAYNNTKREDYVNFNIELREMLSEIIFIDRVSIQTETRALVNKGVIDSEEAALFFDKGYAGKRNAILYAAVKHGVDAVLFLDDDEYPLAVQMVDGVEHWTGQSVLSTHLQYVEKADITNGYHCGYISSIPNIRCDAVLRADDLRLFIEAISNDVINWGSVEALMKSGNITYADPIVRNGGVTAVPEVEGSKFITGSNLCMNLMNPESVHPFYNPPDARGEDTFLATCLQDKTVLRVPCYTFHDGFSMYTSMLHGVLPEKLRHITGSSKQATARFFNTCIGWIRYKPLLLYITHPGEYGALVAKMRVNLEKTLPKLSAYFDNPKFLKLIEELDRYDKQVEEHYAAMQRTKAVWNKLVSGMVRQSN